MVNPSPILITQNYHPDFIRVIKSPNLKDSFVEANQLMDQPGVRGVVWVPEHYDDQNTNPESAVIGINGAMNYLDRQQCQKLIRPTVYQRKISTILSDNAGILADQPHIDGYLLDLESFGDSIDMRCVNTAYGYKPETGTILYEAIPQKNMFKPDGDVRPEIIKHLGQAWQTTAGCAVFFVSEGPLNKKIVHKAPAMPLLDKISNEDATVTRVVDVIDYMVIAHG
jgi:hypothetical protein